MPMKAVVPIKSIPIIIPSFNFFGHFANIKRHDLGAGTCIGKLDERNVLFHLRHI